MYKLSTQRNTGKKGLKDSQRRKIVSLKYRYIMGDLLPLVAHRMLQYAPDIIIRQNV